MLDQKFVADQQPMAIVTLSSIVHALYVELRSESTCQVWLARCIPLKTLVAIKLVDLDYCRKIGADVVSTAVTISCSFP